MSTKMSTNEIKSEIFDIVPSMEHLFYEMKINLNDSNKYIELTTQYRDFDARFIELLNMLECK